MTKIDNSGEGGSARSGAPWVRKFGNHVTYTDRPTDRPSAQQAYQCKISQKQVWQPKFNSRLF